jgi:hypothetical protein
MTDDKTPDFIKGKRSIRITVRGSVNGYVGNKFSVAFGERSDPAAQARAGFDSMSELRAAIKKDVMNVTAQSVADNHCGSCIVLKTNDNK